MSSIVAWTLQEEDTISTDDPRRSLPIPNSVV